MCGPCRFLRPRSRLRGSGNLHSGPAGCWTACRGQRRVSTPFFLRDSSGRAALEPALPTYTMTARRASGGMTVHLVPSGILFHVYIRTLSCARYWRLQRVCRGLRGQRLRPFWTQSSSTVRAYVISEISRADNHVIIPIECGDIARRPSLQDLLFASVVAELGR